MLAVLRKLAVMGTRETGRVMFEESTTADVVERRARVEAANRRDADALMAHRSDRHSGAVREVMNVADTDLGASQGARGGRLLQ